MNLTPRGKTYVVIIFLSFVFSYFIVTLSFFPYLGLSVSLIAFTLFSYYLKKVKGADTRTYLSFTLIFAALIGIRSEMHITFLNFMATLFFGTLMLVSGDTKYKGFLDHIFSPVLLMIKGFFTKSEYYFDRIKDDKTEIKIQTSNLVFGVLTSVILLAFVIPLLSSANPLFQKIVDNTVAYLNLQNLFTNIGIENVVIWCVRLVFFAGFLFFIPRVIGLINSKTNFNLPFTFKLETFTLLLPKIILAVVLGVFFITQYQLYFANQQFLQELGISHSQRTREVFGQLSVVAGIILLLLHNDRKYHGVVRAVNWVLGIQGIFLTFMAYKSAFDYINAWGLTYLRLYGITFATWITGLFILYFRNYWLKTNSSNFVKVSIIFSGLLLLIINLVNFDYLIYHYKKAATGQGVDYTYLSQLTADSLSYKDQFEKLDKATQEKKYNIADYTNHTPLTLLFQIEYLQRKYSKLDLRSFNILEYNQYLQIKDINTGELVSIYENYLPPSVDL